MHKMLPEPKIRLRVATSGGYSLAVPVALTGYYDVSTDRRVCAVELAGHDGPFWTRELGAIEDDYGYPLDYWFLRRALLLRWINGTRIEPPPRGLSPYERQCHP